MLGLGLALVALAMVGPARGSDLVDGPVLEAPMPAAVAAVPAPRAIPAALSAPPPPGYFGAKRDGVFRRR